MRSSLCLCFAVCVFATTALAGAQSNEPPVLRPHPHSTGSTKPATAKGTLLIRCDLACTWSFDGDPKGVIEADGMMKIAAEPGQHLVLATAQNGPDRVEKEVDIEAGRQTLLRVDLQPLRQARLGNQPPPVQQQKPVQQQHGTTSSSELKAHAEENYKKGDALYDEKRYLEALPLYAASCEGGYAQGCNDTAYLYDHALGVTQDYERALPLYQLSCDGGFAAGCNNIGYMYEHGHGVAVDYDRAFAFFVRSCNGGSGSGCSNLGTLYDDGHGVTQDFKRARDLYSQACDKDNMSGCSNLGLLYEEGHGVPQNKARALELYNKACNGGNATACDNAKKLK